MTTASSAYIPLKRWHLPFALFVAIVVRLPFWSEAWRTPLDGDASIIGLMARHPTWSATMWGQPYGSPLEAWLAAPLLAVLDWTPHAVRLYYFLLGLALVPVAYSLGKRMHPAAAFPAALLMACPPSYFLLLSAMPPPLYPSVLLLCGGLMILAVDLGDSHVGMRLWRLALWGTLAGLALWTHLVAASVVVTTAALIFVKARNRRKPLVLAAVTLVLASSPVWRRVGAAASPGRLVRVTDAGRDTLSHLLELLPEIHRPLGGIIGTHTPLVADSGRYVVSAPPIVVGMLFLVYFFALSGAMVAARRSASAKMLLGTVLLVLVAFALPLRARVNTIRYLTPAYLPLAILVAWASAVLSSHRRAIILALSLSALHLTGARNLKIVWHRADRSAAPFLRPDLDAVRRILNLHGVRRAYASYGPAYRLTYESGERLIVSQPRNERFPRVQLPYQDEVRFSKDVAWILIPSIQSDMPTPQEFESILHASGGAWRRFDTDDGVAVVYCDFVPPRSSTVAVVPEAGLAGDGDLTTAVKLDNGARLVIRLETPVSASGLRLFSAAPAPPLPPALEVRLRGNEDTPALVHARRRRGYRLWWANGHPEYVPDPDFCAVDFDPRPVREIQVMPTSNERGSVGEILLRLHGTTPVARSWMEWLPTDLDWRGRLHALRSAPHPEREDWHYRVVVASRATAARSR